MQLPLHLPLRFCVLHGLVSCELLCLCAMAMGQLAVWRNRRGRIASVGEMARRGGPAAWGRRTHIPQGWDFRRTGYGRGVGVGERERSLLRPPSDAGSASGVQAHFSIRAWGQTSMLEATGSRHTLMEQGENQLCSRGNA